MAAVESHHDIVSFGERERRVFPITLEEVRDSGAGPGYFTVSGYAAVYDSPSLDLGGFVERIAPHAFDPVLAEKPNVLLTIDHDSRYILGKTKNGTLELTTDERGLRFWARVAPTSYAADLRILMERGDIDEASFVFTVDSSGQDWRTLDDGTVERTINGVSGLFDVCVTAAGAYPATSSQLIRSRALAYARTEGFINDAAPLVEGGSTSRTAGEDRALQLRLKALRAKAGLPSQPITESQ